MEEWTYAKKKKIRREKNKPICKMENFLYEKALVFPKRVGAIYSKSRRSKKGTHKSFMGNIFRKRTFFRSVKWYFPWLASCLLGRLLLTSLVSLGKQHSQEPRSEAAEGRVSRVSCPEARPGFPCCLCKERAELTHAFWAEQPPKGGFPKWKN